jgi:putative phosphoserine phosphatase/1-acylglycerol-3-phosphate O-acyltransferase
MQAGVPMVPVVIRNAGEIMPARSMLLVPGTVGVRVLPPIPTDDWTPDNLDEQVAVVESLFTDTLDAWGQPS